MLKHAQNLVLFQALAQCENTLTLMKLGLVREAVDDTAGAAKVRLKLGMQQRIYGAPKSGCWGCLVKFTQYD